MGQGSHLCQVTYRYLGYSKCQIIAKGELASYQVGISWAPSFSKFLVGFMSLKSLSYNIYIFLSLGSVCALEKAIEFLEFDNEFWLVYCLLLSGSNPELSSSCIQDKVLYQWKRGDKNKL